MGPGQAARFAQKLASVNKDDPTSDTPGFSAKPVRGNPDRVSVTMDGQTVVMSKNALAALTGTVGQLKEEAKKAKADDEASAQWKSDVAGKISKSVDMFKQGAAERTETMRNPPPDNAGDAGTAIGGMLKPPGQTDKAIPDTAGEAVQPTVDLDERGMPAETSANQQVIDNLLNYRRSLMKVQDDPRAARMLQQINGRLRQLGYED